VTVFDELTRIDELPVVRHAYTCGDPATIAASLQTVIAMQRRVLEYGDTIEPWWAMIGWETIDRLADAMLEAMPEDRRAD
jgi:hypothetical protein